MLTLVSVLLLGFFLGMRHATDPDHVVAVSTIVSRERSISRAAWIGAMWGIGHTATILAVGVAIIVFKVSIPVRLGLSMELSVGVMLVVLGALNLLDVPQRILRVKERCVDIDNDVWEPIGPRWLLGPVRPLIIGCVHGLAGSAAVALLVLGTIPRPVFAVAYLGIFGVGTVAGMMLITSAICAPLLAVQGGWWTKALAYSSGAISFVFGLFIVIQIGFCDGLFRHTAHWIPR